MFRNAFSRLVAASAVALALFGVGTVGATVLAVQSGSPGRVEAAAPMFVDDGPSAVVLPATHWSPAATGQATGSPRHDATVQATARPAATPMHRAGDRHGAVRAAATARPTAAPHRDVTWCGYDCCDHDGWH